MSIVPVRSLDDDVLAHQIEERKKRRERLSAQLTHFRSLEPGAGPIFNKRTLQDEPLESVIENLSQKLDENQVHLDVLERELARRSEGNPGRSTA
jgi:predicted RNase H-like nuclease (RuvC/YqgF family)